mmetsp:Transcript_22740/g.50026  ORF Transcript_22740/g.50026 Transcript_22740/m.50026 type:complete len:331 (+) Transcript_22740:1073-2065(+)
MKEWPVHFRTHRDAKLHGVQRIPDNSQVAEFLASAHRIKILLPQHCSSTAATDVCQHFSALRIDVEEVSRKMLVDDQGCNIGRVDANPLVRIDDVVDARDLSGVGVGQNHEGSKARSVGGHSQHDEEAEPQRHQAPAARLRLEGGTAIQKRVQSLVDSLAQRLRQGEILWIELTVLPSLDKDKPHSNDDHSCEVDDPQTELEWPEGGHCILEEGGSLLFRWSDQENRFRVEGYQSARRGPCWGEHKTAHTEFHKAHACCPGADVKNARRVGVSQGLLHDQIVKLELLFQRYVEPAKGALEHQIYWSISSFLSADPSRDASTIVSLPAAGV